MLSHRGWTIRPGRKIDWQIERPTPGMDAILPSMKTDIVLEGPTPQGSEVRFRTIIDTKFTDILSTGQFGDATLRSGYIYQIYAYLRSQEHDGDSLSMNASGMLLHPSVDGDVDEAATIQGHRIRFATVDLAADSLSIRSRLLFLVHSGRPGASRQGKHRTLQDPCTFPG